MEVPSFQTPRWAVPFLQPARYKGAYGGRGSGKSHEFAAMVVRRCLTRPGTRVVCIREIKHSIKYSVKRLIEDKIRAQPRSVAGQFRIWERRIDTPGGGVIIFEGMQAHNADSIKSLEGFDIAWVEEAQTISQRSLDMLTPTIRKDATPDDPDGGSELWFSWNPARADAPIEKLLRGPVQRPNSIVHEVNFRDNPWFPSVLREEMEFDRARDPDKYAHIWLGKYQQNTEARVFKNWRVGSFELPVAERRSGDIFPLFGADWGATVDPTVLVRCWIVGRTLFIDHEAYNVGCPINAKPALFRSIEDRLAPDLRKWKITADSAWPDTISYMQVAGFTMAGAKKGPDSVAEGIEFLRSFDIVVHPRCRHTIDELTLYSYKVDKLTGLVLPILEDKKNHVIDALRYAVESTRHATTGMIGFLRQQADAITTPETPQFGWSMPGQEIAAGDTVRMFAPPGFTTVYGMTGRMYQVEADGTMRVAKEDVGALRSQGFRGGEIEE